MFFFYDKIRRDNLQVYLVYMYVIKKTDSVALVEKPTTTRTSLLAVDSQTLYKGICPPRLIFASFALIVGG